MNGAVKKILFLLALCLVSGAILADNAIGRAYNYYLEGVKYEQTLYAFEARTDFQKALALDPNNPGYLAHYAWFVHWFGFTEDATHAFNKALQNPQGQEAILYKGLAWDDLYLGNLDRSTYAFQNIYSSHWLRSNYTNASEEAGLLEDRVIRAKIHELKQQLARDPNNFEAKKELFNNYNYRRDFPKAIIVGKELMTNSKTDNLTRLEFARTLFKNKQYEQSSIQYHELMREFPRNAFLSYEWGTKLVQLHQYNAAYEMFSQSLSYYPSAEAKEAMAKLVAQQGNCKTGFDLLSSVSNKQSINYLNSVGDTYRECRQFQRAIPYYQAVLQEYPYNSDALWGVLSSTAASHQYAGNRSAYDHWEEVPYLADRSMLQNELVDYYQSPMLLFNGDYYDNSDTFSRQDWGAAYDFYAVANTRANLSYNYSKFTQDGFNNVFRNMVALQLTKLFTEHWQLGAGISDKDYSNDHNNINGNVLLQYTWSPNLHATVEYQHSDIIDTEPAFGTQIYNYVIAIGAVGLNIQTNDYSGTLYYQATRRLALWGKAAVGDYSDGNTKTQASFEANYQLFDLPQVKIIYNYFYLNFANPAPIFTQNNNSQSAYFDPLGFQVHTGKVRIEHYFTRKLHMGLEEGVTFFPQNSSFGNAILGYIDYKIVTHLALRLAGQYFYQDDSISRNDFHNGRFWAKSANLTLIFKD